MDALGEKIQKRAWLWVSPERLSVSGGVGSPLDGPGAAEDGSAPSLQDQGKQHFSAYSMAFSSHGIVFLESLPAPMT